MDIICELALRIFRKSPPRPDPPLNRNPFRTPMGHSGNHEYSECARSLYSARRKPSPGYPERTCVRDIRAPVMHARACVHDVQGVFRMRCRPRMRVRSGCALNIGCERAFRIFRTSGPRPGFVLNELRSGARGPIGIS